MTYEQILARLDEALAFCSSFGLQKPAAKGRFSEYRRRIEELIVVLSSRREGRLSTQEEARFDAEWHAYVVALSEAYEFAEIVPRLGEQDTEAFKAKLRAVLMGPALPGAEDANSNAARNALFELSTAARFKQAGFRPQLGEQPDVKCNIYGTELLGECKRPFSEAGIGNCAADARRQLKRNLDRTQGPVGMVALSVSRSLNPSYDVMRTPDREVARQFLTGLLERLLRVAAKNWPRPAVEERVVAISLHGIMVFQNIETGMFEVGQLALTYPTFGHHEVYAKLSRTLGGVAWGLG